MTSILESFDDELIERTQEALTQAGIPFKLSPISDGPLEGWKIEVDAGVAAEAISALNTVTQAIDAVRHPSGCNRCGATMALVEPESELDRNDPLYVEYKCPNCGDSLLLPSA